MINRFRKWLASIIAPSKNSAPLRKALSQAHCVLCGRADYPENLESPVPEFHGLCISCIMLVARELDLRQRQRQAQPLPPKVMM